MSEFLLNTDTGLIFHKTPAMRPTSNMVAYSPTAEEIRTGQKAEQIPEVKAHEAPETSDPTLDEAEETPEIEIDLSNGDAAVITSPAKKSGNRFAKKG